MAASDGVKAADVCLTILDLVAATPQGAGVTQIAARIGIAKSAVFKHLQTLADHGFVAQDPESARYRLGPKAWLLARNAPNLDDIAAIALPYMRAARDELGLAAVFSVPTPGAVLVLASAPSLHAIEIGAKPGRQLPLHASAQGKVCLAFGPPHALEEALGQPDSALPALTPRSLTDPATLRREVEAIRRQGYATAAEESLLGVNALAAPVFNHNGHLAGCLGLIGSLQHLPMPPTEDLVRRVVDLARAISRALGADAAPGAPSPDGHGAGGRHSAR